MGTAGVETRELSTEISPLGPSRDRSNCEMSYLFAIGVAKHEKKTILTNEAECETIVGMAEASILQLHALTPLSSLLTAQPLL